MKISVFFLPENFQILMKFSIYFNGRVLVMYSKVKVNKCHEKYNRDYRDRLENITRLFKYIGNFTTKNENFQIKKNLIFLIFLLKT